MSQTLGVPAGRSAASRFGSIAFVLIGGLAWVMLLFPLVFIVPKFEAIFNDFHAALPALTVLVLGAAHAADRCGFFLGALWVLVVGGLALSLGSMRSRWGLGLAALFAAVSFLAVMLIMLLFFVALVLPMNSLMAHAAA
jgi:hypothetical protein